MDIWALSDLCTPWCLHVAVTLRVAERIDSGCTRLEDLAEACGANPPALQSVLRQLTGKGVFIEPEAGRFALNDAARQLLDGGVRLGFDLDGFGGRMAHSWSTLLTAVRTGRPAYSEFFGRSFWDDLDAHPAMGAQFDELMGPGGHGRPDPEVLLNPSDWDSVRTVVDVGGGTGALLCEVLRARPHVRGTLVDLARPVAASAAMFAAAGVQDRVDAVAQSFFDPLPAGHDLYLLKSVLSDWPDREATAILARCAEAAHPRGRVVLLNGVTPEEQAEPDLLMLVLVGGRGRTLAEFRDMARAAGLFVQTSGRAASGRFLVECAPFTSELHADR
jgi:hypothetical protein